MSLQAFAGWVRPNPQLQNVSLVDAADSPYAISDLDVFVGVDSSAGPVVIDLPPAPTSTGRVIEIYDVSGTASTNNITVSPFGPDLISGAASQTISTSYGGITIVSDGTNWEIVATASSASPSASPWSLVETKTLVAAASANFAGLDGDAAEIYWIEGEVTMSAGGQVQVAPNGNLGLVCDGAWLAFNSGGGPPTAGANQQILFPASTTLTGISRVTFWIRVDAQSRAATLAQTFQWQATARFQGPITFQTLSENGSNSYDGAPANLTSIDLVGVGGNMTGKVSLYRLSRT